MLGVPSEWDKLKSDIPMRIKDRVLAKEVLIKVVIRIVLSYVMRFSSSLKVCHKLGETVARFLWSSREKGMGMHWKSSKEMASQTSLGILNKPNGKCLICENP